MSTAQQVISRTFAPAGLVGKVYARERGSSAAPMSIGNVLELELSHKEDVQTQQDMTRLGGGQHAEIRRVTEVEVKMKLADLNANNLARASLGTVTGVEAGTVTDEAHTVTLGGLLRTGLGFLTHFLGSAASFFLRCACLLGAVLHLLQRLRGIF